MSQNEQKLRELSVELAEATIEHAKAILAYAKVRQLDEFNRRRVARENAIFHAEEAKEGIKEKLLAAAVAYGREQLPRCKATKNGRRCTRVTGHPKEVPHRFRRAAR